MGASVEAAVISENKNIENLLFKRIWSLTEDIFDGHVTLYLSLKVRRYIRLKELRHGLCILKNLA